MLENGGLPPHTIHCPARPNFVSFGFTTRRPWFALDRLFHATPGPAGQIPMKYLMFFLTAFTILTCVHVYAGMRLILPFRLPWTWNTAVFLLAAVFLALPFFSITLRLRGVDGIASDLAAWGGYTAMGVVSLLFVMVAARDIVLLSGMTARGAALLAGRAGVPVDAFANWFGPAARLAFVRGTNLAILALTGVLCIYGLYEAKRTPRLKRVTVPVEGLPAAFEGFRIVQITDIHAGPTVKRSFIGRVVREVNALEADIIAVTGDLVDGSVEHLAAEVAPVGELSARHGVFFVTGNHEYYVGVRPWLAEIERLGLIVLENDGRVIERDGARLLVAGVNDFDGGHGPGHHLSDPEAARENTGEVDTAILLGHQPRSVFAAERAGYQLLVSGHTHGGQYMPFNLMIGLQQPYTAGLHCHGATWVYVSRGTGFWGPPLRIGVPSEITVLTLTRPEG